jgi:hypothetical protein
MNREMKRKRKMSMKVDEENANLPSVSLSGARIPRNLGLSAGAIELIL